MLTDNAVIGGLTLALIQVGKGLIPGKFVPLSAAVLGVVLGFLITGFSVTGALTGLISGLASSGFYDQKKIAE